ncbi:MAG: hypothetical protein WCF50_25130, partial [Pseudolabrys sp.]
MAALAASEHNNALTDRLSRSPGASFLMQQSGKRLTILVTNEEVIAIDDFRFKNRMRNRSDAVRALL